MTFQFNPSKNHLLSMTLSPPSEELEWICEGLHNADAVIGQALILTPPAISHIRGVLYRQDIKLTQDGHGVYRVAVPYGPRDPNKWTWDFDTTGGTFNIKASLEHVASYVAAGEPVKDHKGAIGRQLDGTVDGVDIVIPAMKVNANFTFPYGVVTPAFASQIMDLTGMVNSKPMFRRKAGEVLFLGGRGSDGSDAEANVGLMFAVERELQDKLIGGITVARKQGWDYLWCEFKPAGDAGQMPISKPRQIDVCRVYERADFAGILGFGGGL